MRFTIPGVPYVPNSASRRHWALDYQKRKDWIVRACEWIGEQKRQQADDLLGRSYGATVTFCWPDRRRRDVDNALKYVLDPLVRAGVIEDDGPPWMKWLLVCPKVDSGDPRVEIEVVSEGEPDWRPKRRKKKHGRIA